MIRLGQSAVRSGRTRNGVRRGDQRKLLRRCRRSRYNATGFRGNYLQATDNYDAVVLGGGHNGLVCAAYLARAGQKVLVLERREQLGGCAVTEEIVPGFKVSACAHAIGLFRPEIIRDLQLHQFGLDIYTTEPALFLLCAPDDGMLFFEDLERTFQAAPELTARDQAEYLRLLDKLGQVAAVLSPTFLQPPLPELELRERFARAGLGAEYDTVFTASLADFLAGFALTEKLKLSMATLGLTMQWGGPHTKGTAYNLFRSATAQVQGKPGAWGFVRGGMGELASALAQAAQQLGVKIRTGAEVERILVAQGQVTGVELRETGEKIRSPIVISNADPKRTLLGLVEPQHLPEGFRQQVRNIKMRGAGMKILCALDGLPEYPVVRGIEAELARQASTVVIAPSIDYLEAAFAEASAGLPSRHPVLELSLQSATDSTLAPPGKHVLSIHLQYAPYHLREGSWEQLGEQYAEETLTQLAAYIPNLRSILIARRLLTPLQLAHTFSLTEGHWEHGELISGQLFTDRPLRGWAHYATPIAGLYLCGAGTHPGGGLSGAPGHNAARQVLSSLY